MADTDATPQDDTPKEKTIDILTDDDAAALHGDAQGPSDEAASEVDDLKLRLEHALRALAEADNAKKRAEREVDDARAYGITGFARDILSVADNFDRALSTLPDDARDAMGEVGKNLLAGVEMTQKELHSALARHGVQAIACASGDKFDPNKHQAAAQIPSDLPAGSIVDVIQAGWTIKDRTLRPAMVAVSGGPPPKPSDDDDGEAGQVVDTKA